MAMVLNVNNTAGEFELVEIWGWAFSYIDEGGTLSVGTMTLSDEAQFGS
jgi:hypothetical protein